MALFGDNGLITMAQNEKSETENAQANTIAEIDSLKNELNSILIGGSTGGGVDTPPVNPDPPTPPDADSTKVANNLNKVITGENADLTDSNGNKITVPVGFKIVTPEQDSTIVYDYLGDGTPAVQDGIVIENEADKNQFVWVPVGTINNKSDDARGATTNIKLGRYSDFTVTDGNLPEPQQEATASSYNTPAAISNYYFEVSDSFTGGTFESKTYKSASEYGNTKATNLQEWINTTLANGGYYIARYEASKNDETNPTKAASVAGKTVWADINQPDAATYAKATYPVDGTNKDNYYSDLINSYAWDTSIIFIEAYAQSDYAIVNKSTGFRETGANPDKVCNIHDMSGNAYEWSTETSTYSRSSSDCPCILRGGLYSTDNGTAGLFPIIRCHVPAGPSDSNSSFRLTLYVK